MSEIIERGDDVTLVGRALSASEAVNDATWKLKQAMGRELGERSALRHEVAFAAIKSVSLEKGRIKWGPQYAKKGRATVDGWVATVVVQHVQVGNRAFCPHKMEWGTVR